jgi:hypothetical protein
MENQIIAEVIRRTAVGSHCRIKLDRQTDTDGKTISTKAFWLLLLSQYLNKEL